MMISKSVLIIRFGLEIAKARQDESKSSNPNILQSLISVDFERKRERERKTYRVLMTD